MSETLTKIIVDCVTGKQEILPLTAKEIADMEAQKIQAEIDLAEREAQELAHAEAKASAESKLAALGLTAEEIAALKG